MARKIKEAVIIGYGSMGKRHSRNLQSLGIRTVAAADPEFPTKKMSHVDVYQNAILCLDDFAKGRLVVVASPSWLHAEHAINAMYHGAAAVYIEKPMCVNLPDAYEIQDLAEEMNIPVTVGYNFRMHPGLHSLFKLVNVPNYWFGAYGIDDPTTWPTYKRFGKDSYILAETGGLLWTSCSHAIDMAIAIHGKVSDVLAGYYQAESAMMLRLGHSNGGVSSLYNKWMQGASKTSLLTYTSPNDTITIDLLQPIKIDMHRALMSNFLKYIENPNVELYVPSILEACHSIEVLVAVENSLQAKGPVTV